MRQKIKRNDVLMIRGVAAKNPLGRQFHNSANKHFGNIAPYTGIYQ